jgi:hypothetical protein
VRALAEFVLVIGAALGWVTRGARIQRRAAQAIQRAGGQVCYEYQGTETWHGVRLPRWLVDAIGIDYVGNIRLVNLSPQGSDAELVYVADLPRIEELNLHGSSVTERGLAELEDLNSLLWLNLDKTRVTDGGLAHLGALSRLQDLSLTAPRSPTPGWST